MVSVVAVVSPAITAIVSLAFPFRFTIAGFAAVSIVEDCGAAAGRALAGMGAAAAGHACAEAAGGAEPALGCSVPRYHAAPYPAITTATAAEAAPLSIRRRRRSRRTSS